MRESLGKKGEEDDSKAKYVLTLLCEAIVATWTYIGRRRFNFESLKHGGIDKRGAEVTKDDMQIIGHEHISQVGVMPYDIVGMEVSDPFHYFNGPANAGFVGNCGMVG
jgi:hypothetical protein